MDAIDETDANFGDLAGKVAGQKLRQLVSGDDEVSKVEMVTRFD